MRLEASARALLSVEAWKLLSPSQRESEWLLIARAGGVRARQVPELLRVLEDDSTTVRGLAAIALVQREDFTDEAIAALERCEVGTDLVARERIDLARKVLGRRRDEWRLATVAACRDRLASEDEDKLRSALYELGHAGPAALPLAPLLFAIAVRSSRNLDYQVVEVLANCGASIVGPCTAVADSTSAPERRLAARVLGRLRPLPVAAVPLLLMLGEDTDDEVRSKAFEAFGTADSDAVARALIDALRDPRSCRVAAQVLDKCCWYQGWLDRLSTHLDTLAALVPAADGATRAVLFRLFGRDARAVPVLGVLADAEDPKVRHAALWALAGHGPKSASTIATVIAHVGDVDVDVAVAAAACLPALQAEPELAIATLDRRLRDEAPSRLKIACANALCAFGPAAAGSTQLLEGMLTDTDRGVDRAAATALLCIVGAHPRAVELLRKELEGDDLSLRVDAVNALRIAKDAAALLMEPVVAQLGADDQRLRSTAAAALREMGAAAASALPALRAALGRDQVTDFQVGRAIEAIETAMRR